MGEAEFDSLLDQLREVAGDAGSGAPPAKTGLETTREVDTAAGNDQSTLADVMGARLHRQAVVPIAS
jgi:hypothetical protein